MSRRLVSWLLKCYPAEWRSEYGSELEDILCRQRFSVATVGNVLRSAVIVRLRRPAVRFFLLSLLVCGLFFFGAVVFAAPLWRFVSAPVLMVLRDQGVRPPALVSVRPLEAAEVVWLGIPFLVTAFVSYPATLLLAWTSFARASSGATRRLFISFAAFSGTLFAISFVASAVAWQRGSLAWLLEIAPDTQNTPMVSLGHCFELLAASTLGVTALLQIPVLIFFGWRVRMMQLGRRRLPF